MSFVRTTKKDLIERMKNHESIRKSETSEHSSNLSQSTLDSMAQTKKLVDSGQLPKYVGTTDNTRSDNLETEKAKRILKFTGVLK